MQPLHEMINVVSRFELTFNTFNKSSSDEIPHACNLRIPMTHSCGKAVTYRNDSSSAAHMNGRIESNRFRLAEGHECDSAPPIDGYEFAMTSAFPTSHSTIQQSRSSETRSFFESKIETIFLESVH